LQINIENHIYKIDHPFRDLQNPSPLRV
jgi:hypothetical protein